MLTCDLGEETKARPIPHQVLSCAETDPPEAGACRARGVALLGRCIPGEEFPTYLKNSPDVLLLLINLFIEIEETHRGTLPSAPKSDKN